MSTPKNPDIRVRFAPSTHWWFYKFIYLIDEFDVGTNI